MRFIEGLVVCLVLSCQPIPTPAPPSSPSQDASTTQDDPTCETACQHLRSMGCLLGQPTQNGAECEAVCWAARNNGLTWPVWCLSKAPDCETAEVCR